MDSLHAAMQRVRSEVLQPYSAIRMQTSQMSNLHRTTDMLRHVLHRLKLIGKLKVGTRIAVAHLHSPSRLSAQQPCSPSHPEGCEFNELQRYLEACVAPETSQTLTDPKAPAHVCTALHLPW